MVLWIQLESNRVDEDCVGISVWVVAVVFESFCFYIQPVEQFNDLCFGVVSAHHNILWLESKNVSEKLNCGIGSLFSIGILKRLKVSSLELGLNEYVGLWVDWLVAFHTKPHRLKHRGLYDFYLSITSLEVLNYFRKFNCQCSFVILFQKSPHCVFN